MKKVLFILALVFVLIGCSQPANEKKDKQSLDEYRPKPDLSTPDRAILSYWKNRIWEDTSGYTTPDTGMAIYATSQSKLNTIDWSVKRIKSLKLQHYYDQNMITKVEIESDSRAVVYTTEYYSLTSTKADKNKYVLTKERNKWLIDTHYFDCLVCNGTGKSYDYLLMANKDCKYCTGTGWVSYGAFYK